MQIKPVSGGLGHKAKRCCVTYPGVRLPLAPRIGILAYMRHPFAAVDAIGQAHTVSQAAAPAEPAYATLYATCAALMIAVLVVFYFDQRVRDHLTRGSADTPSAHWGA